MLNRVTQRFFVPVTPGDGSSLGPFLSELSESLSAIDLHVLDANLWTDGGKGRATPYHNDLWFGLPLENRVLQLWMPILGEGDPAEISRSMLRVDPRPLPPRWACGSGTNVYTQMWTGEERPLPFEHDDGRLIDDLPEAVGGRDLRPGDVLHFDNSCCHYTLPSKAYRVGLAVRLCRGQPVYNGYFDEPRPLEGATHGEENRLAMKAAFTGLRRGDEVPLENLLKRRNGTVLRNFFRVFNGLLFVGRGRGRLSSVARTQAQHVASELAKVLEPPSEPPPYRFSPSVGDDN